MATLPALLTRSGPITLSSPPALSGLRIFSSLIKRSTLCLLLALPLLPAAHATDVSVQITLNHPTSGSSRTGAPPQVVVWLSPLVPGTAVAPLGRFRLAQKDKMFQPHLLVVPVGSTVDFPNLDPFFHNVFSLFNGKRFDLGLYEAGATREVHFNREGVSFLFCNIHPEMSAVILALATPFYGRSTGAGPLLIHDVPPGAYRMSVWAEGVDEAQLHSQERLINIPPTHTPLSHTQPDTTPPDTAPPGTTQPSTVQLGTIQLLTHPPPEPHKNKFGQDYTPTPQLY